jgi:5-methyltetrahydrofolate corrinoid/iron sulfur protein methyltransferase
MEKFVTIGERIHCISPVIRDAFNTKNPEPDHFREQKNSSKAGVLYLMSTSDLRKARAKNS